MINKIQEQHKKSCEEGFVFYSYPTNEDLNKDADFIRQPTVGIQGGKLACFSSDLFRKGLYTWFKNENYLEAKKDFVCAARARILSNKAYDEATFSFDNVLFFLLSDSDDLVAWLSQDVGFMYKQDEKKVLRNVVNDFRYHKFNFFLAMQKKWDFLEKRSIYALEQGCSKRFLDDHVQYPFYVALARGDIEGMRDAVLDIVSPKRLHKQNKTVSPLSRFYLSAWGTLFAKLAMRNGYDLEIDSPWVPRECLPVEPLVDYETPYDFLNVDIFTPYENLPPHFSPKPLGEEWFDITLGSDPTVAR